jgi:hypothetical protein
MRILSLIVASLMLVADPGRAQVVQSIAADPGLVDDNPCDGGGDGGSCTGGDWCPPECRVCGAFSAIMINTGQGDWDLSGLADPVTFDLGSHGGRQTIAWTARGSDLAFLALDRYGNGTIDDGMGNDRHSMREIFLQRSTR